MLHRWLHRFLRKKVAAKKNVKSPEGTRQDLANTFVEHHLTVEEVKDVYFDSYIDAQCPENSDGLSSSEAR